jgi:hypothetical protein
MYKGCLRGYQPSGLKSQCSLWTIKFRDIRASANPLYRHNPISIAIMDKQIEGLRVAIVVTDGFEQDELVKPRQALDEAGENRDRVTTTEHTLCGRKNNGR